MVGNETGRDGGSSYRSPPLFEEPYLADQTVLGLDFGHKLANRGAGSSVIGLVTYIKISNKVTQAGNYRQHTSIWRW